MGKTEKEKQKFHILTHYTTSNAHIQRIRAIFHFDFIRIQMPYLPQINAMI